MFEFVFFFHVDSCAGTLKTKFIHLEIQRTRFLSWIRITQKRVDQIGLKILPYLQIPCKLGFPCSWQLILMQCCQKHFFKTCRNWNKNAMLYFRLFFVLNLCVNLNIQCILLTPNVKSHWSERDTLNVYICT